MSATPNNAAPGWENTRPPRPAAAKDTCTTDGHNALQGLLAFACIHQQAARRKREAQSPSESPLRFAREEELALDEILQLVAVRAIAITGADGIAIALAKDRAIVCRASAGKISPDPGVRLDPNSGFSGACLRTGEIVRCDDSENDSRVNPQACRALGARSMIAVPLSAKKRVIGLLEAFSSETFGFNDSDVRSLNLLGELILAAIRPEEEHHLAVMAREVLPETTVHAIPTTVPPPAVQSALADKTTRPMPSAATPVTPTAIAASPQPALTTGGIVPKPAQVIPTPPPVPLPATARSGAKVLVDEKFSSGGVPPKSEAQTPLQTTAAPASFETVSAPNQTPDAIEKLTPASAQREKRAFVSILLPVAGILIVIGLAGGIAWRWQHLPQSISASTQTPSATTLGQSEPQQPAPAPPLKIGTIAQVTAIQHSSTADSSTVVIDLEDQVQYEEHTLDNPPRIYFDLHDTKLAATVPSQTIAIDDAFLKRVRVAQPVGGITRVVLETKGQPDSSIPSVSLNNNPYRLTIEFRKAPPAPVSPAPGTQPKPSPAINALPSKPRASSEAQGEAVGFEVVLDAGHGGWDLGAVGRKGLLEKELVFDVVQRLGSLLESRLGATVVYTRQDDTFLSLEKRAEIANLSRADLFLSVHANYSDLSTARGVETYYTNTYSSVKARTPDTASLQEVNWSGVVDIRAKVKGAKVFASDIQQALFGGLAARNPGLRNRGVKEAEYVVLTGTQMPAVLAEISYVSSPADEDRLQSSEYRQVIAEALYQGIARYRQETQRKIASLQKVVQ